MGVREPVVGSPWADRVAGYIHDPVMRLRFLRAFAPDPERGKSRWSRRIRLTALIAFAGAPAALIPGISLAHFRTAAPIRSEPAPALPGAPIPMAVVHAPTDVWLVEKTPGTDTYSNGLRIDNRFLIATHPRSYLAFPVDGSEPVRRSEPVGIVFHTTENQQAPFEASDNRNLKRIGESLLEYVRRRQAYNFVIDRFGRVYRVVAEDEAANHSGNSAWADESSFYLNLNESFLGISFEAATAQGESEIGPAQVGSAAMLIEMLRRRYRIPSSNYVTHAQVSLNPSNMRAGLHLDWASGFPFEAVGLTDNYAAPLPALWAWGFDYDANFAGRATARLRLGVERAEAILIREATAAGVPPAEYKNRLRRRYRAMVAQVRLAQLHIP